MCFTRQEAQKRNVVLLVLPRETIVRVQREGAHLEQLTEDHRLRIAGEASTLTRALGVGERLDLDYRAVPVTPDDLFVFAKGGQLRDQTAGRVHRDRVAVENKLVVTADGVAIEDRPLVNAGERSDHLQPNARFVQAEW